MLCINVRMGIIMICCIWTMTGSVTASHERDSVAVKHCTGCIYRDHIKVLFSLYQHPLYIYFKRQA